MAPAPANLGGPRTTTSGLSRSRTASMSPEFHAAKTARTERHVGNFHTGPAELAEASGAWRLRVRHGGTRERTETEPSERYGSASKKIAASEARHRREPNTTYRPGRDGIKVPYALLRRAIDIHPTISELVLTMLGERRCSVSFGRSAPVEVGYWVPSVPLGRAAASEKCLHLGHRSSFERFGSQSLGARDVDLANCVLDFEDLARSDA